MKQEFHHYQWPKEAREMNRYKRKNNDLENTT
jgi:hypothetical protein